MWNGVLPAYIIPCAMVVIFAAFKPCCGLECANNVESQKVGANSHTELEDDVVSLLHLGAMAHHRSLRQNPPSSAPAGDGTASNLAHTSASSQVHEGAPRMVDSIHQQTTKEHLKGVEPLNMNFHVSQAAAAAAASSRLAPLSISGGRVVDFPRTLLLGVDHQLRALDALGTKTRFVACLLLVLLVLCALFFVVWTAMWMNFRVSAIGNADTSTSHDAFVRKAKEEAMAAQNAAREAEASKRNVAAEAPQASPYQRIVMRDQMRVLSVPFFVERPDPEEYRFIQEKVSTRETDQDAVVMWEVRYTGGKTSLNNTDPGFSHRINVRIPSTKEDVAQLATRRQGESVVCQLDWNEPVPRVRKGDMDNAGHIRCSQEDVHDYCFAFAPSPGKPTRNPIRIVYKPLDNGVPSYMLYDSSEQYHPLAQAVARRIKTGVAEYNVQCWETCDVLLAALIIMGVDRIRAHDARKH